MNNFVTINKTVENIIRFTISVQGVSDNETRVWFSIKAGPIDVNIPCVRVEGDDGWECTIPPLPFVEITAYPCSICMVADGYFFEPMTGTIDIIGSAEIYARKIENVSFAPRKTETETEAETPAPTAKPSVRNGFDFSGKPREVRESAEDTAKKLMAEQPSVIEESIEAAKKPNDRAVDAILKDLGIEEKIPTTKRRPFSLR